MPLRPQIKTKQGWETLLSTFQIPPLLRSIKMLQNPRVKMQVGRIPGAREPKGLRTHGLGSSRENSGSCGHAWNIRREQFQHQIQSPRGRGDCGDTAFLIFNPAPVEHGTQENPKSPAENGKSKPGNPPGMSVHWSRDQFIAALAMIITRHA